MYNLNYEIYTLGQKSSNIREQLAICYINAN